MGKDATENRFLGPVLNKTVEMSSPKQAPATFRDQYKDAFVEKDAGGGDSRRTSGVSSVVSELPRGVPNILRGEKKPAAAEKARRQGGAAAAELQPIAAPGGEDADSIPSDEELLTLLPKKVADKKRARSATRKAAAQPADGGARAREVSAMFGRGVASPTLTSPASTLSPTLSFAGRGGARAGGRFLPPGYSFTTHDTDMRRGRGGQTHAEAHEQKMVYVGMLQDAKTRARGVQQRLQQSCREAKSQVSRLEKEAFVQKRTYEDIIADYKQALRSLMLSYGYRQELENLDALSKPRDNADIEEVFAAHEAEIAGLKAEIKDLEEKLEAVENEAMKQELAAHEREELEAMRDKLEEKGKYIEYVEGELQRLTGEIEVLQKEANDSNATQTDAYAKLAREKAQAEEAWEERLEAAVEHFKSEKAKLKAELEEATQNAYNIAMETSNMEEKLQGMRKDLTDVRREAHQVKAERDEARGEVMTLQEKMKMYARFEEEAAALKTEIDKLTRQCEEEAAKRGEAEGKVPELEAQVDDLYSQQLERDAFLSSWFGIVDTLLADTFKTAVEYEEEKPDFAGASSKFDAQLSMVGCVCQRYLEVLQGQAIMREELANAIANEAELQGLLAEATALPPPAPEPEGPKKPPKPKPKPKPKEPRDYEKLTKREQEINARMAMWLEKYEKKWAERKKELLAERSKYFENMVKVARRTSEMFQEAYKKAGVNDLFQAKFANVQAAKAKPNAAAGGRILRGSARSALDGLVARQGMLQQSVSLRGAPAPRPGSGGQSLRSRSPAGGRPLQQPAGDPRSQLSVGAMARPGSPPPTRGQGTSPQHMHATMSVGMSPGPAAAAPPVAAAVSQPGSAGHSRPPSKPGSASRPPSRGEREKHPPVDAAHRPATPAGSSGVAGTASAGGGRSSGGAERAPGSAGSQWSGAAATRPGTAADSTSTVPLSPTAGAGPPPSMREITGAFSGWQSRPGSGASAGSAHRLGMSGPSPAATATTYHGATPYEALNDSMAHMQVLSPLPHPLMQSVGSFELPDASSYGAMVHEGGVDDPATVSGDYAQAVLARPGSGGTLFEGGSGSGCYSRTPSGQLVMSGGGEQPAFNSTGSAAVRGSSIGQSQLAQHLVEGGRRASLRRGNSLTQAVAVGRAGSPESPSGVPAEDEMRHPHILFKTPESWYETPPAREAKEREAKALPAPGDAPGPLKTAPPPPKRPQTSSAGAKKRAPAALILPSAKQKDIRESPFNASFSTVSLNELVPLAQGGGVAKPFKSYLQPSTVPPTTNSTVCGVGHGHRASLTRAMAPPIGEEGHAKALREIPLIAYRPLVAKKRNSGGSDGNVAELC